MNLKHLTSKEKSIYRKLHPTKSFVFNLNLGDYERGAGGNYCFLCERGVRRFKRDAGDSIRVTLGQGPHVVKVARLYSGLKLLFVDGRRTPSCDAVKDTVVNFAGGLDKEAKMAIHNYKR